MNSTLIFQLLGLQGTVATEYFLSTQVAERPSTSSSLAPFDCAQRVPELLTALKNGNPTAEDALHAEVCLAWLHWIINEPTLALSRLPTDIAHVHDRLTQTEGKLTGWTHVCIVKGGYLQGESYT
jgi:cargo-transport protein YPP1